MSLRSELEEFQKSLLKEPAQGTNLGNNTYKVRLAVKSKGKGKSGGMRIITYIVTSEAEIYLLTIYDKSELENIDNRSLQQLINDIPNK